MDWLSWEGNELLADGISIASLASTFGTPLYVYSANAILSNIAFLRSYFTELPADFFYAVKANSSMAILSLIASQGLGAEVVSQGELFRATKAGFPPQCILFTGVGKTKAELLMAASLGIHAIVIENFGELEHLRGFKKGEITVALRVNLGLDVQTHPDLRTSSVGSKFGLDRDGLRKALRILGSSGNLRLTGLHTHLGSQVKEHSPYLEALDRLVVLAEELERQGFGLQFLDLGGGFHLDFPFPEFVKGLKDRGFLRWRLYFEPGRFVVANAGILVTRILYTKKVHGQTFAIVDAGMNDFIRPALYGAEHPVELTPKRSGKTKSVYVVGPVCESTDKFGSYLLKPFRAGDLLVFQEAGAYGASMASHYNSRPRPAEVLIHQGKAILIRSREAFEDLIRNELFGP
jgi:diaminopimelate decarboxylase